ncbi:NAD(P)-binding protein [Pyxidicoccus parkwayensis]|uniref:NAD(P)-binding protein n=1 Tax=Pyxidicoccus parkwayensis TaxID=2813578 RepID=A0ABX7NX05_9BACT|nr:NAD(P)-binding protein [Pyxidicoccus parkwaysis]QSQ23445.1 NAD(P)-binding protein [Pyxidicoccus parkwaysis]
MIEGTLPHGHRGPARVHIYGGGIAGLTAAHELARRGFRVRVYEPAQEYDELGRREPGTWSHLEKDPPLALGGMARSQFMRVAKGAQGNFPRDGSAVTSDAYRFIYDYSKDWFTWQQPDGLLPYDATSFVFGIDPYSQQPLRGVLHIRVPEGHDGRTPTRRDTANALLEILTVTPLGDPPPPRLDASRIVIVDEEERKFAERMGAPFPPLEDKDELALEMLHFLPGEHGFRFFPSYYRHLFSTMVETPILDDRGQPTGRRVFDNLVPSSFYGIAAKGRRIRFLSREPPTRPVEILQELLELASSGYPPSDTTQFTLRIWRYLSTCSERRKAEYEGISWWEYLEGFDPKTGARRYQYSDAFKRDMQFAPRVLAAFDGKWGDARTNGNTLAQLYLNNLLPMPKTDGTLNGPTTPAWFRPWRRYLQESLRVEFRTGRLTRFALDERRRLIPYVFVETSPRETGERPDRTALSSVENGELGEPVDYYVVATDAVSAEAVTKDLEPPLGVIEGLRGFTTTIPANPRGPEPKQPRTPGVLHGHVPWDRFQTLTGIQFFFPSSVRLAEGYLYFLDAPWGLSAINSQQYWATPPTLTMDGFASVLSVDIGNWYVREPRLKSPSLSSRHEIAHEVWRQVRQATEQHNATVLHSAGRDESALPQPDWYSMDRYIVFKTDETGTERPVENLCPYLIPIVGDWDRRPGAEPWDPMAPEPTTRPKGVLPEGLWQAEHGGYQVHWEQLVFAGTYLKTFTRMTTMESANESARHAVNAIIDHLLAHPRTDKKAFPQGRARPRAMPFMPEYPDQGTLTGSPYFQMTPLGEYCRIWDPEKNELAELTPLRDLDAKLYALGLPHIWDVLHLEPLALPFLSPLQPFGDGEALKSFLGRIPLGLAGIR